MWSARASNLPGLMAIYLILFSLTSLNGIKLKS